MKQPTTTFIISFLSILFAFTLSGITSAEPPKATETMSWNDFGTVELFQAVWKEPLGPEPTLTRSKSIIAWHEDNFLLPYKTTKMTEEELIQKIKKGPVMVIYPKKKPDVKFWISLGENAPIILVENTTTEETHVYGLPPEKQLDMSFISLDFEEQKK